MVGDAVDLIGVLRTENDDLRERLDQIAHGVKTWLLPTLEGHAAAIGGVVTHCANSVAGPPARPDIF